MLGAMGLDECRVALSGAAPLSTDIMSWFNKMDLEILEVYGMTENFGWSHTTEQGDQQIGWVGTPNDGVECRIGEAGEVEVRSVANMSGYYKQADLTAEVLTEDGWLKTGDIGEIACGGSDCRCEASHSYDYLHLHLHHLYGCLGQVLGRRNSSTRA